jgi:uncharacterized caspase-like protein
MHVRRGLGLQISIVVLVGVWLSTSAYGQARTALVIGNSAYRHAPALPNTTNDANDVSAAFERLGFTVQRLSDGRFDDVRRGLLEFTRKANNSEIGVIFFAGHGMEVGGENWLIPVDAELKSDRDAEHEAISLRNLMMTVSSASKLGLVILDACRNNPFTAKMQRTARVRAVARGFTAVEPSGSVLVLFAARDGTTAADGDDRNSPFTTALLRHLETSGLEINFLFRNIRDDVIKATRGEQEPFVYGSLSKEPIYLKSGDPIASLSPPSAPAPADEIIWSLLKDSTDRTALRRFVEQFPESSWRKEAEARIAALTFTPGPPPAASPRVTATPKPKPTSNAKCFVFQGRSFCE